jgi:hypothetical protein
MGKSTEKDHAMLRMIEDLRPQISKYAVEQVKKQFRLVERGNSSAAKAAREARCTYVFTTTWGIPCKHTIWEREQGGYYLSPSDFHAHWHLPGKTVTLLRQIPVLILYQRLPQCHGHTFYLIVGGSATRVKATAEMAEDPVQTAPVVIHLGSKWNSSMN